jgi:hypothetical protein
MMIGDYIVYSYDNFCPVENWIIRVNSRKEEKVYFVTPNLPAHCPQIFRRPPSEAEAA